MGEDIYRELISGILKSNYAQCVQIKGRDIRTETDLRDIVSFLYSQWCKDLCEHLNIDYPGYKDKCCFQLTSRIAIVPKAIKGKRIDTRRRYIKKEARIVG